MLRGLLVVVLASGCIEDQLVPCGENTCPVGYLCVEEKRCTPVPRCGDGLLASGEVCDGAALGDATCQSEGFYTGTLACTAACGLDTTGCSGRCGDGTQDPVEQCDGSTPTSCFELGASFGRATCGSDCQPSAQTCLDLGWQVTYTADAPIVSAVWVGDRYFLRLAGGDVVELAASGEVNRWPQLLGAGRGDLAGTSRSDVWLLANDSLSHFDGTAWSEVTTGLERQQRFTVTSPTRVVVQGESDDLRKIAIYDGTTWTLAATDHVATAMAASETEVFVVGQTGLHRYDGTTWTAPAGGNRITDVASDGTTTFAVGDRIYRLRNGVLVPESPQIVAERIHALGAGRFLAFTNLADAYEYDGLTWTQLRTPSVVSTTEITEAGFTAEQRVTLVSGQKVQLSELRLGDQAARLLWAFDDAVWIQRDGVLVRNGEVRDASTAERSLAWGTIDPIDGDTLFIARNNNGGAPSIDRCTRLGCTNTPIGSTRLVDLEGSSTTDVWALTGEPTVLYHFDGQAWSQKSASLPDLTDLAVAGPDDVYLVGPSASIIHYDGQSFVFTDLALPAETVFHAVLAFPDGRAFASSTAGVFENVGGTWTPVLEPVSALTVLGGSGPEDVYALGLLAMYHRDATGWVQMELPDLARRTQRFHATDDALWFDTVSSFSRLAPRPR